MTREEFKADANNVLNIAAYLTKLTTTEADDRVVAQLQTILNNTGVIDIVLDLIEGKLFAAGDLRHAAFTDAIAKSTLPDEIKALPWAAILIKLAEFLALILKKPA